MTNEKPLLGHTILVTRARRDKDELVNQLETYGAKVLYSPTIEIVEPESIAPLDQAINRLSKYDWVIFTSRSAVEVFIDRLKRLGKQIEELIGVKILAVGSSTAKALEKAGILVTLIPEKFNAEGALASLQNYYQNNELLAKCCFLFPRAAMGRDLLPTELEKLGAQIDLVIAYQTSIPKGAKEEVLTIFANEKIDLITFTSPSTINNLVELVAPESLDKLLKDTAIASIGPVTTTAIKEAGLVAKVCPNESTALSLAEAIKTYFK